MAGGRAPSLSSVGWEEVMGESVSGAMRPHYRSLQPQSQSLTHRRFLAR
jgi:hypothetical protein